jgi:predicted ATPase/predicted MPP superfamily phosphohydrolase
MSDPIRILHLSDFHFREGEEWDSDEVLDGLTECVAGLAAGGLLPDLIALTGDIAFSGRSAEYQLAHRWIEERLLPATRATWNHVLVIPGNHDVDRNWIPAEIRQRQVQLLEEARQESITAVLSNPAERDRFLARHREFLNFAGAIRGTAALEVPWWGEVREVRSVKVGLMGLNSAWMSTGKEDQGRLILGKYQVSAAAKHVKGADFIVALIHHPPSYLREFDEAEVMPLLRRRCRLILSGHRHLANDAVYGELAGEGNCLELTAGSAYSGATKENSFQLIEVEDAGARVSVHHRVWRGGSWRPNRDLGEGTGTVCYPRAAAPARETPAAPPRATNLSPAPDRFVGREGDLNELARLLCDEHLRVVTLLGPGGMGKTRLSQELGLRLLQHYPGGVWFADLTEARTSTGIVREVMAAFGVAPSGPHPPEETVANLLEHRGPLLLILDNFEQVRSLAPSTLGFWRARASHVQFLVTSRRTLPGESYVYALKPLPYPVEERSTTRAGAPPVSFEAVQLFIERARQSGKGWAWTPDEDETTQIARIVRTVEGIPLAIQIAAARVRVMSLRELADMLCTRMLAVLSNPEADGSRHSAMAATIGWSFDLLSSRQQELFPRFSAFRGGFSMEAIEAVLAALDPSSVNPLDLVHALLDATLVQADETPYGMQYRMYGTVREYLDEHWARTASAAEREALTAAHAEYYVRTAERWKELVEGPGGIEALDRLDLMVENLMIAFERMVEAREFATAARALLSLSPLWNIRAPGVDRVFRLEPIVNELDGTLKVEALVELSAGHDHRGRVEEATALAETAVSLAAELDPAPACAMALSRRGEMLLSADRYEDAIDAARASEEMCRALSYSRGICQNLHLRAHVHLALHEYAEALRLCEGAEKIAEQRGDLCAQAKLLDFHGNCLWWVGRYEEALTLHTRAAEVAARISAAVPNPFLGRADALNRMGDLEGAMRAYDAAEQVALSQGDKFEAAAVLVHRTDALIHLGDCQEAERQNHAAELLLRELNQRRSLAVNLGNRAILLLKLERLAEARSCATEAVGIMEEVAPGLSTRYGFILAATAARIEEASGHHAQAVTEAVHAMKVAADLGLTGSHPDAEVVENVTALGAILSTSPLGEVGVPQGT